RSYLRCVPAGENAWGSLGEAPRTQHPWCLARRLEIMMVWSASQNGDVRKKPERPCERFSQIVGRRPPGDDGAGVFVRGRAFRECFESRRHWVWPVSGRVALMVSAA